MEQAALLLILATLASKLTDFLKFVKSRDWNATITQIVAWGVGTVVVFAASAAKTFQQVKLPSLDVTLSDLDGWSKVLVGTATTSLLSLVYDVKKAIDNTDSAKAPPLTKL